MFYMRKLSLFITIALILNSLIFALSAQGQKKTLGPTLKLILGDEVSIKIDSEVREGQKVITNRGGFADYVLQPYSAIRIHQTSCTVLSIDRLARVKHGVIIRLTFNQHKPFVCLDRASVQVKSEFNSDKPTLDVTAGDSLFDTLLKRFRKNSKEATQHEDHVLVTATSDSLMITIEEKFRREVAPATLKAGGS